MWNRGPVAFFSRKPAVSLKRYKTGQMFGGVTVRSYRRRELAIKRSWVRFPVGPLSSYLGQLSLPSLRGRYRLRCRTTWTHRLTRRRGILQIRRHVDDDCLRSLVHAFITSRLDYCNFLRPIQSPFYGSYSKTAPRATFLTLRPDQPTALAPYRELNTLQTI